MYVPFPTWRTLPIFLLRLDDLDERLIQVSLANYMPKCKGAVCNCYSKHRDISRNDHEFQV